MSFVDRITRVMDFSQKSLENTLGTVKEVHQTILEIPINIAQELGYSEDSATALKAAHRRILDHIHGGLAKACGEVNQYVVNQAKAVSELASPAAKPATPALVELERKTAAR